MNTKQRQKYEQLLAFTTMAKGSNYTIADNFIRLSRLADKPSRIDTQSCNGDLLEADYDKVLDRIEEKLNALLSPQNIYWFHQRDPRGASLYISLEKLTQENYNSRGVAIY
jgi:hypothetical protein